MFIKKHPTAQEIILAYDNKASLSEKQDWFTSLPEKLLKTKRHKDTQYYVAQFLDKRITDEPNIVIKHEVLFVFGALADANYFEASVERDVVAMLKKKAELYADSIVFVHEYLAALGFFHNSQHIVGEILLRYRDNANSRDIRHTAEVALARISS